VGKKPLFWAQRGGRFWFASELGSLLVDPELSREVEPAAIEAYLAYQYVPHPLCAVRGIRKLAPASILTITEGGTDGRRYWWLSYDPKTDESSEAELAERLLWELREATRIRLMSEVPLGAFLSGGLDSSAVVAAMAEVGSAPVKTFSVGFPEGDFDERRYARLVATRFGTDHHELEVTPDAVSIIPRLARQFGEPFADPSAIPSFYVAEMAARHVTVALNGDGGDESFAGYDEFVLDVRLDRYLRLVPGVIRRLGGRLGELVGDGPHHAAVRSRVSRAARIAAMPRPERFARWLAAFDADWRRRLLTPEFRAVADGALDRMVAAWHDSAAREPLDRMLDVEVRTYLPDDLLVKIDIVSMAHSLEARSPFLDHKVMEFCAALPARFKLQGSSTKHILRRALAGILPEEVLTRRKMGFSVPLAKWLRSDLRSLAGDVLLDPRTIDRGYFRPQEVERVVKEHTSGVADHTARIWTLLALEMWHREVLERPAAAASVA
jgi:asparagine synthase (glutamine-hydrolysing)